MPLSPGTRLGPYEVLSPLGAGGMGEVYRARDPRIGRDVAVKVLPSAFVTDVDRLRRFEQEVQTVGALNHPNILVIYDVGTQQGSPYIVSELLEGETLRERLAREGLSQRKAIDYGRQIATGLGAAHAKGIVHRDLKPGNLFLTKDGLVKILDFGLAKLIQPDLPAETQTSASTISGTTQPGVILGTAGYMSPEQIRGQPVDHRADIFSFGIVLYEMLTGKQAFPGDSTVEVMNATLKGEAANVPVPTLDLLVRRCLEKNPDERFQSARDLAFALEALARVSATSRGLAPVPDLAPARQRKYLVALAFVAVMALCTGAFVMGMRTGREPSVAFHRLTFRRGRIHAARFAPDGNSVIYSARWENEPSELFNVRLDIPGSRALGFSGAELRGISSSGELALALNPRMAANPWAPAGMLAQAPFSGGAPRSIEDKIDFADWSRDGKELAVVRETGQGTELDFPLGKVLYRTGGYISNPRISPAGDRVAFVDHPVAVSNRGLIAVVDRTGQKKTLTGGYSAAEGLAWSATGDEVWFTAATTGSRLELRAVTLSGRERVVYSQAHGILLQDISKDGRVLIASFEQRSKLMFRGAGDDRERELSWLDWSLVSGLSLDGKIVVFSESGEGAGASSISYFRETSGAPAVNLGAGSFPTLSPDGRFVVTSENDPPAILIHPVGPGQPKRLAMVGFTIARAGLLPDGRSVWFNASEPSHGARHYLTTLEGEKARPITPEGVRTSFPGITPDGNYLVGLSGSRLLLYPVHGGEPRVPKGVREGERIAGGSEDGRWLFVFDRNEMPTRVYRVHWETGRREVVRELAPTDPAGIFGGINALLMTPDAKAYAYSVPQQLLDLHWVQGLK